MKYLQTKILLFSIFLFGGLSFACGQEMDDSVTAEKVSFEEQLQTLEVLKGDDKAAQEKILQEVGGNPDAYIPPILHRYAGSLFKKGKPKKGWFWHFVAELRGRIDANLTTADKAQQFVAFISKMNAAMINPEHNFKQLDQLEKTVQKVVLYVRSHPVAYQHDWLVQLLLKIEPSNAGEVKMKPKHQWAAIKQHTIDEYYKDFQNYVQTKQKD